MCISCVHIMCSKTYPDTHCKYFFIARKKIGTIRITFGLDLLKEAIVSTPKHALDNLFNIRQTSSLRSSETMNRRKNTIIWASSGIIDGEEKMLECFLDR